MNWIQHKVTLPKYHRGFHLITKHVIQAVPEIQKLSAGLLHVFLLHTSASLTLNENADPDVPQDLETSLNTIVPETLPYRHTLEGPDDMPAHVKTSLLGASLLIPVHQGVLCLGTWQGIYLCEHRDDAPRRSLMLTLQGEPLN